MKHKLDNIAKKGQPIAVVLVNVQNIHYFCANTKYLFELTVICYQSLNPYTCGLHN